MDSDGKFWVCVWSIVALVLIALIISLTITEHTNGKLKIEAIAGSKDPIATGCAFGFTEQQAAICLQKAGAK